MAAHSYTRLLAWLHLVPNHGIFFVLFLWRAATKPADTSLERTLDVVAAEAELRTAIEEVSRKRRALAERQV